MFPFHIATENVVDIPNADRATHIIHMASIALPTFYRQFPLETLDANVGGLRNLLDFYRDKPVKRFLFYSSSEIYGDPTPDAIPTSEEYRGLVSSWARARATTRRSGLAKRSAGCSRPIRDTDPRGSSLQ